MEAVAEGLWALAEHHEQGREIGKAVKCLEAICQSSVSFLPIIEIKTRLRVAALLLKHSHNVNHAKSHLERAVCVILMVLSMLTAVQYGSFFVFSTFLDFFMWSFFPELVEFSCGFSFNLPFPSLSGILYFSYLFCPHSVLWYKIV